MPRLRERELHCGDAQTRRWAGRCKIYLRCGNKAGPTPCPLLQWGLGSGTADKALLLAKRLLRDVKSANQNDIAALEKTSGGNQQAGLWPQGWGKDMAVHIETYPTHIAGYRWLFASTVMLHGTRPGWRGERLSKELRENRGA